MNNDFSPLGTTCKSHFFWLGGALRSPISQHTDNDLIRVVGQAVAVGALALPGCLI